MHDPIPHVHVLNAEYLLLEETYAFTSLKNAKRFLIINFFEEVDIDDHIRRAYNSMKSDFPDAEFISAWANSEDSIALLLIHAPVFIYIIEAVYNTFSPHVGCRFFQLGPFNTEEDALKAINKHRLTSSTPSLFESAWAKNIEECGGTPISFWQNQHYRAWLISLPLHPPYN